MHCVCVCVLHGSLERVCYFCSLLLFSQNTFFMTLYNLVRVCLFYKVKCVLQSSRCLCLSV